MDCNLGSEIGQKMRSAVKAKLLELGTGGSAGFIDDELPDYVMVMVANKRTKQQMNAELNLFLGDQTDLFVTWLHEVLQKLQEVTLPASSASSKKRKSRQGETTKAKEKDKEKEKDKKLRDKKDKRPHRKSGDELPVDSSGRSTDTMPAIGSITDVFAEELLEKAKKSMDVDSSLKEELAQKKKKRKSVNDDELQTHPAAAAEEVPRHFDIPTMSEISSTTISGNREKDIAELLEVQRKISAAKQHLRQIGELDDASEDDDDDAHVEDVLNLNEQDESVGGSNSTPKATAPDNSSSGTRKPKSPIVFHRTPEPETAREKPKTQMVEPSEERSERRSVHDRLGSKPLQQHQQPQTPPERPSRGQKELELYVPAHRRRGDAPQQDEDNKKIERGRERSQRNNVNDSQASRPRRERERERDTVRSRRTPSPSPESSYNKHRIGSRVIVAINKPPVPSDDEDILDKPVNSVIKIKPRPQVSPSRQACKNLLMRAVADAQRSTILAKTVTTAPAITATASSKQRGRSDEPELISSTLGKRRSTESAGGGAGKELFRRSRRELLVNVLHGDGKRVRQSELSLLPKEEVEEEEEYVPAVSVKDYVAYVPQLVHGDEEDLEQHIDLHVEKHANKLGSGSTGVSKTQFVVTLNGDKSLGNVASSFRRRSRRRTPSPQVSSTSSTTVHLLNAEPSSTTGSSTTTSGSNNNNRRMRNKRGRSSSHSSPSTSSNTPPPKPSRSLHRSDVLRPTQEIKKIIIKNDVGDDDEDEQPQQALSQKRASRKRLSSSSNMAATSSSSKDVHSDSKQHLDVDHRSTTPPLPPKQLEKREREREPKKSTTPMATVPTTSIVEPPAKAKHTPIKFKLKPEEDAHAPPKKRRSGSKDRDSSLERRRISIRSAEDRKYDNLPSLSAVNVDSQVLKVSKPKERCKYHPNCNKQFCEYYHPTAPCKSFPNCKFADKCMYSHPKCKFDLSCISIDCNFAHSGVRDLSHVQLSAPPLSSHVIPVQNYKSISAPVTATTATTMCKYYPNCTKVGCTFYHPKPCRYGKNCINKLECIFYHPEMQSKFKWVASLG